MSRSRSTLLLLCAAGIGFIAGRIETIAVAQAADPRTQLAAVEIKELAIKSQLPLTQNLEFIALKAKVDQLAQALQISGSNVTLRSNGTLTIEAAGNLKQKAGATLELESAQLALKAAAAASIQGSPVRLNNGGKPVAYFGGKTVGSSATQTITEGSTTVLVP